MEPIQAALASSGVPAAVDAARSFADKLLGPASEEFGLILQDRVRGYRLRKQVELLARTQEMLANAGIRPSSVPLKTFVPLLEGASLEQEAEMFEKWAALLANAAASSGGQSVLPRFPIILQQLSPSDAVVLDFLADQDFRNERHEEAWIERSTIREGLGFASDYDVALVCDNLIGHGLAETSPAFMLRRDGTLAKKVGDQLAVKISELGYRFVKACSPPQWPSGA